MIVTKNKPTSLAKVFRILCSLLRLACEVPNNSEFKHNPGGIVTKETATEFAIPCVRAARISKKQDLLMDEAW